MKLDFLKDYDFFTGVPDSQLKPLCDYLIHTYGISQNHLIAANEGNCVALAAGYYLATGKVPVVYMQNSGIGNIINPVASLLNEKVYGIPLIFIIGWRGEPGVHDEPQHVFQGEITLKLLETIDITPIVIEKATTEAELAKAFNLSKPRLSEGKSIAFVIKKNALECDEKADYKSIGSMPREKVIQHITQVAGEDIIVSTTGKASRELFEIREQNGQSHARDFLTVGSMGHASSIALGIALKKPDKRVWCLDGDGAALMHMGSMPVIGANKPNNFIHVILNNAAHETVGGMPTVANHIDWPMVAKGCGYENIMSVDSLETLDTALNEITQADKLSFLEVKIALGSRNDLGRPTIAPYKNKENFMTALGSGCNALLKEV